MERVFGPDGVLLENADPDCIFAIRQICLFAKKLKLPCSARKERAAELAFIECDTSLRYHGDKTGIIDTFYRVSDVVWTSLLSRCPFGDPFRELVPRHGPGTTQEGVRGNAKFRFASWPSRLEKSFPYAEFGIASIRNFDYEVGLFQVSQPSPKDETPVRVVFVPKTQRTPRVIAIEPVCMQYMQQAIATWLRPRIEHSCPYTSGRVNFTRQDVNATLARTASREGHLATLDMSEASDRVSARLVWHMLRSVPDFRRQVFACRSSRAELPSGVKIPLRKFASMGSALCFPIESLAFFVAIVSSRLHRAGVRPSPATIRKYCTGVYVYGDDLIVPTDEAPSVCNDLESFGFKVNTHKSFWTGKFRESCGMDAYDGVDVTPVYVRRLIPADRTDSHGVASTVALANQFYLKGYWQSAKYLRLVAEKLLGELPSISLVSFRLLERVIEGSTNTNRGSAGLGWISFSNAESFNGWHRHFQCLKSKRWVVEAIRRRDHLDGDAALLKCFGVIGNDAISPTHLRESVRFGNLALKRRWITL